MGTVGLEINRRRKKRGLAPLDPPSLLDSVKTIVGAATNPGATANQVLQALRRGGYARKKCVVKRKKRRRCRK